MAWGLQGWEHVFIVEALTVSTILFSWIILALVAVVSMTQAVAIAMGA